MKFILLIFSFIFSLNTYAQEDACCEGTSEFLPWLWHGELKPTLRNSLDEGGQLILATGVVSVIAAKQYDQTVYNHNFRDENKIMDTATADIGGYLGSGGPGIAIALVQLMVDPVNGLQHSK
ncbi:MAG: PAP2 family protein, partial [Bdellovibrio sp.]